VTGQMCWDENRDYGECVISGSHIFFKS
jgi:hypothetical protein